MKSLDLEEQEDADVYDNSPARNDSSSGEVTRRKASTYRSKHSETEQRRRSKINERFQTLMDLIPQNDQKRDKASFLLEVIEYIQFLQERLQMYEGSHQMWNQGPTKLIPWRSNHRPAKDASDHSQIIKSWPSHEKGVIPSRILSDTQNPLDPDVDSAVVFKAPDQTPAGGVPSYTTTAVSSYFLSEPLLQSVQQDPWQVRPNDGSAINNTNELPNFKDETSVGSSIDYSQGVLNTLTEALKSSGVNLSETMISVQFNVRKSADPEFTVAAFSSEDNDNGMPDEKGGSQSEARNVYKESDHVQKRIRR